MRHWTDFLSIYREQTAFHAATWVHNKCILFDKYLENHGLSAAVVSVSGGVDSAVTLALLKHTAELPNSHLKKIIALSQPIHSSAWALERATELCKGLDIPLIVIDQSDLHNQLVGVFASAMCKNKYTFAQGQLRSYMRTPVNYYAAQISTGEGYPAVVMGTGNKDEDGYLAYFCKYGDGAVDVQLISDLHKSQVFQVGAFLQVPPSILNAAPSADLWDGQTDEAEMGFSYDFIEFYTGAFPSLSADDQSRLREDPEFAKYEGLCTAIHKRNAHKLAGVVNL